MEKIRIIITALTMMLLLSACGNKTVWDTTYTFDKAIVRLPNDTVIEGEVEKWNDYEGEQI